MWFRPLFRSPTGRSARPASRRPPHLEALDDRSVPAFLGPVSYAADAQEVVAADFNNDHVPDLAVTMSWRREVGVLLGNGDGTFAPVVTSPAGFAPHALAVGDFNADGRLDVALAHSGTNDLSVLLGDGLGGFAAPLTLPLGSEATGVAAGDFNGDGRCDLGVGSNVFIPEEYDPESGQWMGHYEGYATALLSNGDGSFGAAATTALGLVGPSGPAAVVDYNGDGRLDLATSNVVLLGDGAGHFPNTTPGFAGDGLADFNRDGDVDLLLAGYVWLSDGQGDFGSWPRPLIAGVDPAVGDFDGDGVLDITAANTPANAVSVQRGVGDGGFYAAESFALPQFGSFSGPSALAAGDFNRDGWLDAVAVDGYTGHVSVLINDRSWSQTPRPSVRIDDTSVREGNAGTTAAVFTVSLSGAYPQPVSVHYATGDGDATVAGGDYQPVADGLLTFAPGETTKTISVLVNGDRLPEGTAPWFMEDFVVRLSNPTNADFASPARATAYAHILDDEPVVAIDGFAGNEGNAGTTPFTFTVTLSAASDLPVTVDYGTFDFADATAGIDYAAASGTLTFAPGQTRQTITVLVTGDRVAEPDESFGVGLGNPTNARLADDEYTGNSWALGTIRNDDAFVRVNDASTMEGHSGTRTLAFTATLSVPPDQPVSVAYATSAGSATAGGDYQSAAGTLTFAPGETSKTVTVLVNGDRVGEPNETFVVNLSGPINATIADGQGVGTILDDEPRISISNVTKYEGKKNQTTSFTFTVTLSAAYDQAVTMSFRTVDGTATTGDGDYVAKTGTLTFAPGETTKTITIEVKGDSKKEADETFYVDLFGLSSNALFTRNRGVGTILNDD